MLNLETYKKDLKTLVAYNSEQSAPQDNAPFGTGCKNALDAFISIAKRMGFSAINYDGYAAEVNYGDGEEIGIIGHLDIVPAGSGWKTNPFELTEKDGYLYGRGVADDKGPTLAALYALKELKDSGIKCNKKFRLFAGCNEETGWQDVEYLKTKTTLPVYGFSPDGNFPVSYSEKGVYVLKFKLPTLKNFYNLKGGTAINAVCDEARVKIKAGAKISLPTDEKLTICGDEIISLGKAAHGSAPHLGVNAFFALFEFMSKNGESLDGFIKYLFNDELNIGKIENEQGNVTVSPDIVEEKDGDLYLYCDCRVPAPVIFEKEVKPLLDKTGLCYMYEEKHPPFMVPKNCEFVKTLINAYNTATGENAEPVKMGGSTFARVFKQGCSFGFEFEDENNRIHEPDERYKISSLIKAYEIIKTALFMLAES